MYYHKKPEIEKRIEDVHRLCQLLVDYCSQIFTRSLLSSRRFDNFHVDQHKFESSNSNPESVVEDPELDSHAKSVADGFGSGSKDRSMNTNPSDRFVLVEDSQTYYRDESEKIDDTFVERSEVFRPLEQLVEDNFKYMNELSRRLDERRRCNKELKNQIEKVTRENQLLKSEIASLHMKLQNQASEDNIINTLMCSSCLKSKVRNKSSKLSRMKSLFLNAICVGESRIRRRVIIENYQTGSEREPEITRAE